MNPISFLRQFRIGPFAIFDTFLAYLGMYFLAPLLSKLLANFHIGVPRSSWLWWMLPISIFFHWIFNQDTPLMKAASSQGSIIVVILTIFMIFMGVRGCKLIK